MPASAIEGVQLDHVAHAVPRWQDLWDRYAVELGAEWKSGGPGPGFAPGQLRFGNSARIELLMPNDVHVNDFLQRFLEHNGPGPHHLTFTVPDLSEAIDRARAAGFEPIGIDRSDPEWMEAFLHPKSAAGVVVQLAETLGTWASPPPDDFPTARRARRDGSGPVPPADLLRVVHAVADLDSAADLFVGLLGAQVDGVGVRPDHRWMELGWGGPLSLRLVAPMVAGPLSPLHQWLGGRVGRVHHLEFRAEEPGTISGATPGSVAALGLDIEPPDRPYWLIGPETNLGLGLTISAARSTGEGRIEGRVRDR
jgi:catechol 2,3-dioxygenase-like lactoylglutathione lyase family enzyme